MDKNLEKEIKEYCKLNGLSYKAYVDKLLRGAFMVDKYGDKPCVISADTKKTPTITEYSFELPEKPIVDDVKETPETINKREKRKLKILKDGED